MNSSALMFGRLCYKQITFLCFHQARYVGKKAKNMTGTKSVPVNPGIERRLVILREENPNLEDLDDEELNIEELESDFMEVGNMHKDHLREKKKSEDALAYAITKSKYFKPPQLPNLLMWNEKEQIRNLHQLDPVEWDPETLSKGFPASTDVIKKIIKSKWKPSDIERHDRGVQRNWAALVAGKFNLDSDLRCHLLSFSTQRQLFSKEDNSINEKQIVIHNKPKGSTEFSNIVSESQGSYCTDEDRMEDKKLVVDIPGFSPKSINTTSCDPRSDSFVVPSNYPGTRNLMPLREFKEKLKSSMIEEGEEGDDLSKRYYEHLNTKSSDGKDMLELNEESIPNLNKHPMAMKKLEKYKMKEASDTLLPHQMDAFKKADNYQKKIKIPKGNQSTSDLSVYRVKDCFYDTDGKFLYRVPGMS